MAFFRGDPKTTRISTMQGGFRVSQKKQVLSGFRLSMFTADDRWYVQGDHRLQLSSQNTYGLGAATLKSGQREREVHGRQGLRNLPIATWRRASSSEPASTSARTRTSAPATAFCQRGRSRPYMAYSQDHGFSPAARCRAAPRSGLLYDTRDNGINPQRGWLASSAYRTFYKGFLGGDSSWQELYLDLRTYRKITADGRHKLAFWAMSDLVTNGIAPYFDLPTTGGDGRSARGYSEGRYRGNHLAYGEVEYRGTLTSNGLLGHGSPSSTQPPSTTPRPVQKLFETGRRRSAPGCACC
jgi:outer membrane protein assembly factor BamA